MENLVRAASELVGEFQLYNEWTMAGAVGCALETAAGNVYTGINIDLLCGVGFCAEHAAVAEMLKHRETQIRKIVAVTSQGVVPPCGRCREMLLQVDRKNTKTLVAVEPANIVQLSELVPHHWLNP